MSSHDDLRARILDLVGDYHAEAFAARTFVPGETMVPVSGRVFDSEDMRSLVDASLDFWLTTGRFAEQFEKQFARWFGIRTATLVNSGSSANLLAVTALTSPKLGDRRLKPGRRGHHGCGRLSDDPQSDYSERFGSCFRR